MGRVGDECVTRNVNLDTIFLLDLSYVPIPNHKTV